MAQCATHYFTIADVAVGRFERHSDGNTLLLIGQLKKYHRFYFETLVTSCFEAQLPFRIVHKLIQPIKYGILRDKLLCNRQ